MVSATEPQDIVDRVMTPTETGCLLENYAEDVLDVLEELGHDYMPVVDGFATRRPLGVVGRHELRQLVASDPGEARVAHVLLAGVPLIPLGTHLTRLTQRLAEVPVALVVDHAGTLAGFLEIPRVLPWIMGVEPGQEGGARA
jgi:CBS domain-containing protein